MALYGSERSGLVWEIVAAVALGLAVLLKTSPIVLMLYLLALHRYRLLLFDHRLAGHSEHRNRHPVLSCPCSPVRRYSSAHRIRHSLFEVQPEHFAFGLAVSARPGYFRCRRLVGTGTPGHLGRILCLVVWLGLANGNIARPGTAIAIQPLTCSHGGVVAYRLVSPQHSLTFAHPVADPAPGPARSVVGIGRRAADPERKSIGECRHHLWCLGGPAGACRTNHHSAPFCRPLRT